MIDATDRLVLREELRKAIKDDTGVDIPRGTMDQWCSPSRGEGPPVKGYLGRRPLYSVKEGIAWALSRVSLSHIEGTRIDRPIRRRASK
jgi:hypothetical protein